MSVAIIRQNALVVVVMEYIYLIRDNAKKRELVIELPIILLIELYSDRH
ncbi:MAG: hypothetical protein QNJ53_27675 [Pleurocapsa sp. MO_192.B19]|nr:hypothetical protein [Pleurocapsa sp. MO_192.B19]